MRVGTDPSGQNAAYFGIRGEAGAFAFTGRSGIIHPMTIQIAQVKVVPERGNPEANHALLMDVLGELAPRQPDVVVTPEGFLDGYVSTDPSVTRETIGKYAVDPQRSPYAHAAADWAGEHRAWLIYGCTRTDGAHCFNSALIFDRRGAAAGWYDKVHLQLHNLKYSAGAALPVFPSDFGPFGVMICADRRWPETVRTLALKGARVIFNPTYGMADDLNLAMMRTRSYESEVFIAFTHPKQALVTGPGGVVLCDNRNADERFAVTEIDPALADEARENSEVRHLRDRHPEVYTM